MSSKELDKIEVASLITAGEISNEPDLWNCPCYIVEQDPTKSIKITYQHLQSALKYAESYRDEFAKNTHSYDSFLKLIKEWESTEWLRNFGMQEEVVYPKEKKYTVKLPDEQIDRIMPYLTSELATMYNTLQLTVVGINAILKAKPTAEFSDDRAKANLEKTMNDIRKALCHFRAFLYRCGEFYKPLNKSFYDITKFSVNTGNIMTESLLIYRDTMNYLEYLVQIFEKLDHEPICPYDNDIYNK